MKHGNLGKVRFGWKKLDRMNSVWIWIAVLIAVVAAGCVEKPQQQEEIILSNYPKLFEKDVIIVIGENATQIESDGAKAIAYNLGELTGNEPTIKMDAGVIEKEKSEYNLILVGRPDVNRMLKDVYDRTNATKVTDEYPSAGKGVLEIVRNPWNESKVMLLVEGSDEWGVRAGSIVLEEKQKFEDKANILVDWEDATGIKFPIDNAEEAIKYANMDVDVKRFIKEESAEGRKPNGSARFLNTSNEWVVGYGAISPVEKVLYLYINPNGTIRGKGVAT